MRMLLKFSMQVEKANHSIKNGNLPKLMQGIMGELKPEAAYFTTMEGMRTGLIFFDLKDTTLMPSIAEPLFMELEAEVKWYPVMNPDDLKAGLELASKKF
jgi:hypothetical protein